MPPGGGDYGRLKDRQTRCDVWWAPLASARASLLSLLDAAELSRAAAYRRRDDHDRFVLGVALMRIIVGRGLGVLPAQVPVDRTCAACGAPHGRPVIVGGPPVSISHSGEWVVLAVAGAADGVGVDVEAGTARWRPAEVEGGLLAPAERDALAGLDEADRRTAVLRTWVRKESVVKATGEGLLADLPLLTVSSWRRPAAILGWPDHPDLVDRIQLRDLADRSGHPASLAVLGAGRLLVTEHDAAGLLER